MPIQAVYAQTACASAWSASAVYTQSQVASENGVNYVANSQKLTFTPGSVTEKFIVRIDGSKKVGTDYFLVNLTDGSVPIGTAQAAGIIVY